MTPVRASADHPRTIAAARRWLAALACSAALLGAWPAAAAPSYMSYFGLAWNIAETQDHVNLYWAVSWAWDADEVLAELADAKARGMPAIVHTEFVFFEGSGAYANACPYALRPDAAARWDAFVQTLSREGLLDTVAALYPVDEPDLCGVSSGTVLTVLDVIRAHPLTSGKPVAVIFTCDVARKYGGLYRLTGGHDHGDAVRAYDWVGVDCYGVDNFFTDAAWSTLDWDPDCFCLRWESGPSYYDNLKAQLDLSAQRVILVPQGFIAAGGDGLPDDPQLYAERAAADPSVILMAPFTWFDLRFLPGVRSQPALARQWRHIGQSIAIANPPKASPPLPLAIPPRLQVTASDVRHFSVYDLDCNAGEAPTCAVELVWQALDAAVGTQLFMYADVAAPQFVACGAATGSTVIPRISEGIDYRFELYQTGSCAPTIAAGAAPIASVDLSRGPPATTTPVPPPSYQGLWWNSPPGSEPGWGVSLAHQGNTIFAIWYTYDAQRAPLWLAAELRLTAAGTFAGDLFMATGPAFDNVPFDAAAVVETVVGTASLAFADVDHGTFTYAVSSAALVGAAVAQSKSITRHAFGPLPTCAWGGEPDLSLATNYQDLWWNAPAGSEPGWGVGVSHQGDTLFATWFTHDAQGMPRWRAFTASRTAPGRYVGDLFTTEGPALGAMPFDPASVRETVVGAATLDFTDGNRATFGYALPGVEQSKAITRHVFVAPGTACQQVPATRR